MATDISNLMAGTTQLVYYDEDFRAVLEDHMTILQTYTNTVKVAIQPGDAATFVNDFYGLMAYLGEPPQRHWLLMRMMGFTSPDQSDETLTYYLKPDTTFVERLRSYYMTNHTVKA
jgi:hypothetical protein